MGGIGVGRRGPRGGAVPHQGRDRRVCTRSLGWIQEAQIRGVRGVTPGDRCHGQGPESRAPQAIRGPRRRKPAIDGLVQRATALMGLPGESRAISRIEADVVVVGGGGAGLAAALEAAECGRRVILLEKNPHLGGTTLLAVGSVSACRTPHQRRTGVEDSPEELFEDMGLFNQQAGLGTRDNLELRRLSYRQKLWMSERGDVPFLGKLSS